MSVATGAGASSKLITLDRSPSGYRTPDRQGRPGREALVEDLPPVPSDSDDAERVPQLLSLTRPRPSVERRSLHTFLLDLDASRHEELLLILPRGTRPCTILPAVRSAVLNALNYGVKVRMLYQHAARGDLVTRASVRELTNQGADVRTCAELVDPFVASDQELALLPTTQDWTSESRGPTVVAVRDPDLISFGRGAFENLWHTATPFIPATKDLAPAIDDLKKSIVRLLAMGHKDELVSRRLGISVRTCRRHIAEIMEELDASSRFQAGVNLTQAGILDSGQDRETELR